MKAPWYENQGITAGGADTESIAQLPRVQCRHERFHVLENARQQFRALLWECASLMLLSGRGEA